MENNSINTHESYGLVSINNVSCNPDINLFGSSIKHGRYIALRIKKAKVNRDLHREWYSRDEAIIEVNMSSAQFAELITTPNSGEGVPCTISYLGYKRMEPPPHKGHNEVFNQEIKKDFSKVLNDGSDLIAESRRILKSKGNIKVADKKILLEKLESLIQHINDNVPFLHKQFTRSMDKTVASAKAEIESFYTNTIIKMGKKSLEGAIINTPEIEQ